jgi:hypothetical protein
MNAFDEEDEEENYGDEEGYPNPHRFGQSHRDEPSTPSLPSLDRKDQPTENGAPSSFGVLSATRLAGLVLKR